LACLNLYITVCTVFLSFSFLASRLVSSKSRNVKLSGNNSRIFWPECRLVLLVFFGCYGRPWLFSLSQAMTQGERSVKWKRRQNSNRTKTIAGSPLSRTPWLFESKPRNNPYGEPVCRLVLCSLVWDYVYSEGQTIMIQKTEREVKKKKNLNQNSRFPEVSLYRLWATRPRSSAFKLG